jgi:hypothetical protein
MLSFAWMETENTGKHSECTNIHFVVQCKYSVLCSTEVFVSQICLRGSERETSVLFKDAVTCSDYIASVNEI